jgi:hypothetical protein
MDLELVNAALAEPGRGRLGGARGLAAAGRTSLAPAQEVSRSTTRTGSWPIG